ncbi:hypothetical protein [Methanosalsum natronophilum]|nr:hypothetical protein [Methanosalsum natronophilum]MCS3924098.1 hypothetical protein [Methanosalsum natronophilum]
MKLKKYIESPEHKCYARTLKDGSTEVQVFKNNLLENIIIVPHK